MSVVQLVKVSPYSFIVVNGDIFHPGPAWSDGAMEGRSAVDTIRYHVYFLEKAYNLQNPIHFFPHFKPRFSKPLSVSNEKGLQSVLKGAYSDILLAHGDGTGNLTAPRQSSNKDLAAPAALAGPS